jgi:hypothetical protein
MAERRMIPIRNLEMDYWNFSIDEQYDGRKNSVKSEMIDEINDISDKNYDVFKKRLKVDKLSKDIHVMYKDYNDFVNQKGLIEQQKKNALDKSINALESQLQKYNKVRKWQTELSRSLLKEPEEHDVLLKKLCHEETEKAYYASPKGRALKLLDESKKRCKHTLHAGLDLNETVGNINLEMKTQKINLNLPDSAQLRLTNK